MYYNFCKIHKTPRVPPAVQAGVADRVWDVVDIVKLVEDKEPKPGKRGPYKKSRIANSHLLRCNVEAGWKRLSPYEGSTRCSLR